MKNGTLYTTKLIYDVSDISSPVNTKYEYKKSYNTLTKSLSDDFSEKDVAIVKPQKTKK